jgi:outer membrane lipoprotein-sorting protein
MRSILSIVLLCVPFLTYAQSALSDTAAAELLRKVDALVSFQDTDLSAEYLIEKRDPGGAVSTTRAAMFRRDRTDQFLILILEPAIDKGKGYLKQGETLWLYDPVGKTFTFTSAKDRFQNSSARNSDFNRSAYAVDYKPLSTKRERLGKFDCTVFDLEATNNRGSFPKVRLWVSDDNLVRKIEDSGLSGQLMRTTAVPTYQKIGDRWLPLTMVIQDNLRSKKIGGKTEYERTTITISQPSLKALPDSVYTKEYLEFVSK